MDNHIRKDSSVSWLVEIQTVCKEIFSTFNWGKNYNFFLQICKDLDIEMKKLTTFQMTRLTNIVFFIRQFARNFIGNTTSIIESNS